MGKSKSIPDPTWTDPSAEKHRLWNRVYKLPNRRERNHHSPVWEHLTVCLKRGPKLLASDDNITAEMILPHRKCAGTKRPHGFVVNCSASPASFQLHTGQAERKQNLAFCRDVLHEIRCAPTQSGLVPLLFRTDRWAGFCWVVCFCCPALPFFWFRQQGSWVTSLQSVPWPCLLSPAQLSRVCQHPHRLSLSRHHQSWAWPGTRSFASWNTKVKHYSMWNPPALTAGGKLAWEEDRCNQKILPILAESWLYTKDLPLE